MSDAPNKPTNPPARPGSPVPDLRQAKASLRKLVRNELRCVTQEQKDRAAAQVIARLRSTGIWRRARTVLCYAALRDELDLSQLVEQALREGRKVALPQFEAGCGAYRACEVVDPKRDLTEGKFGIREPGAHCPPVGLEELDLILVPGLAFDTNGHRLGRGGGFYDRLLANARAVKCGVGFDQQVRAEIPVEGHDVLLDCIVTPGFWLEFSRKRHGDELVG